MSYKVAVLVGSVDPDSLNRRLAKAMELAAPDSLEFVEVPIDELPFYQSKYDREPTEGGSRARELVKSSDAVLIVTPEYNRSMPAVLKNALDWLSRPIGESAFMDKPVLIAGASGGAIGTAAAQAQVRSVVPMLGGVIFGSPELYIQITKDQFAEDGTAAKEGTQDFLATAMEKFAGAVEKMS